MAHDETLVGLARAPLQTAAELARLASIGQRGLRRLTAGTTPPVGSVILPGVTGPVAYYYLTAAGVARAAAALRIDPAVLTANAGLGRRALQRRLIRLEHLLASRSILVALARDAAAHGTTAEWRPWPI